MTDPQILALVSAVLPFLISLATYMAHSLLSRLPKNRQTQLSALAADAVHAAEQLGAGQSGQVKKQIASDLLTKLAADFGVKVNPSLISGLIEAAVYSMNAAQPQTQPTTVQADLTRNG